MRPSTCPRQSGSCWALLAVEHRDGPYGQKASELQRRLLKRAIGKALWCLVALAEDQNCSLEEAALLNLVHLRDTLERGQDHDSGDDRP